MVTGVVQSNRPRQHGFTLLEILVVVGLIAMLSLAVLTVPVWTDDSRKLDTEIAHLSDTLTMLSEQSLFSGKLLALRLTGTGWTPLQYDIGTREFVPVTSEGLQAQTLPPGLELSWQLDQLSLDDAQSVTLQEAAQSMVSKDLFGGSGPPGADEEDERRSGEDDRPDDLPLPQVYFFPSGESTPVTFTLRSRNDFDLLEKRQLTALGQVRDPVNGEAEEARTVQDLQRGGEEGGGLFDDGLPDEDDGP